MTCHRAMLADGTAMIICMRGQRTRRCPCGRAALYLCDARRGLRSARTCDQPLCDACRTVAGDDRDLCRMHAALGARLPPSPKPAPLTPLQLDLFATPSPRSSR